MQEQCMEESFNTSLNLIYKFTQMSEHASGDPQGQSGAFFASGLLGILALTTAAYEKHRANATHRKIKELKALTERSLIQAKALDETYENNEVVLQNLEQKKEELANVLQQQEHEKRALKQQLNEQEVPIDDSPEEKTSTEEWKSDQSKAPTMNFQGAFFSYKEIEHFFEPGIS